MITPTESSDREDALVPAPPVSPPGDMGVPIATPRSSDDGHDEDSDDALVRAILRAPPVPPPIDLAGAVLGRYRVIARLGAGGMGIVYEAEDTLLRRRVALKLLPAHLVDDPERRRRFIREARAASAAAHPNVAAMHDIGEASGHVFLAMELVRGRTLRRRLVAEGRLDRTEALRIALAIARGVARAHSAGIVHRDLKPENVMLTDDGEVKVLDFGLARAMSREATMSTLRDAGEPTILDASALGSTATADGRVLGTPAYMAPEQALGRSTDARADVFALGVILHEMLTGARPSADETTAPRGSMAPADAAPDPPPELVAIVRRCLDRDPERRYANAEALAAALVDRTKERRDGRDESSTRRRRRRGAAALVLSAAIVGVIAAGNVAGEPAVDDGFERGRVEFHAHLQHNQLDAARVTLDRLRELPLRGDEDIALDKLEADLADAIGDYRSLQAAAARAAAKARRRGNKAALVAARDAEQWALYNLGEPRRMREALEEMHRLQIELGDVDGRARTVAGLATLAMERGELAEARRLYDEVLSHFRPQGFTRIAGPLEWIVELELRRGRLDEVDRLLVELEPFRDRPDYRPQAAAYAVFDGRRSEQRGDLNAARARFDEALEIYREYDDNQRIAGALLALGRVLADQGDLDGARGRIEEANTIYKTLGTRRRIAETQAALARLALAAGEPARAESLARAAEAELARTGALDGQAIAAALCAQAVAAQGRREEAAQLLAPHLARQSESAEVRTRLAIAAADPTRLDEAIRDDQRAGLIALAREAEAARASARP